MHNTSNKRRNIPTPVASPTAPPQLLPNNIIKRVRGGINSASSVTVPVVTSTTSTTTLPVPSSSTSSIIASSVSNSTSVVRSKTSIPLTNITSTTTTTTTTTTSPSLFDPVYINPYLASSTSTSPPRYRKNEGIHGGHTEEEEEDHTIIDDISSSTDPVSFTVATTSSNVGNINSGSKGKPRVSYAGLKAYGGIGALYWTDEEDNLLRQAVEQIGDTDWTAVAKLVPRRTAQQCLSRWTKALKAGTAKGEWSTHEDNVIRNAVAAAPNGVRSVVWTEVAQELPGRIGKQCRERWLFHLDPSINKDPFTDEEDRLLFETQRRIGNKWSEIAQNLPGRNENTVKNRWNSIARRKWFIEKGLPLEERDAKALLAHAKLSHLDHTDIQNLQRAASLADPGMPFMNHRPYDIRKGWAEDNIHTGTIINSSSVLSSAVASSTTSFVPTSTDSSFINDTAVGLDTMNDDSNHVVHDVSTSSVLSSTTTSTPVQNLSMTKKSTSKRASRIIAERIESNTSIDTENTNNDNDNNEGNEYSTIVIKLPPGSFYYILGIPLSSKQTNKDGYQTMNNQPIYLTIHHTPLLSASMRRPLEIIILLSSTSSTDTSTNNEIQLLSPTVISQLAKLGTPGNLITALAAINATLSYPDNSKDGKEDMDTSESTEPIHIHNLVNSVRDLKLQNTSSQARRTGKTGKKDKDADSNNYHWRLDIQHDSWVKEHISNHNLENSISDTGSNVKIERESRTKERKSTPTSFIKLDPSPIRTEEIQPTKPVSKTADENSKMFASNAVNDVSNFKSNSPSIMSSSTVKLTNPLPSSFISLRTPNEEKSISSGIPFPSPSNDRFSNTQSNMIVDTMTNAGVNPSDLTYTFTIPAANVSYYGIPLGPFSNSSTTAGLGMSMNALPTTTTSTSSTTPPYSFSKWNTLRHNSRGNIPMGGDLSSPSSPPSASGGVHSQLSTPTAIVQSSISNNFFLDNATTKESSAKSYNKVSTLSTTIPSQSNQSMSNISIGSNAVSIMVNTSPDNFGIHGNTFTIPSLSISPEENNTFVIPTIRSSVSSSMSSHNTTESDTRQATTIHSQEETHLDTSTLRQITRSLRNKRHNTKHLSISTSTIMVPPTLGTSGTEINMSPNDQTSNTVIARIIPDLLSSRSNSGYAFTVPADVKNNGASSSLSVNKDFPLPSNGKLLDSSGGSIPYLFSNGNMSITSTDFAELMGNTPRAHLNSSGLLSNASQPSQPKSSSSSSGYKSKGKFMFDDIALQGGKE